MAESCIHLSHVLLLFTSLYFLFTSIVAQDDVDSLVFSAGVNDQIQFGTAKATRYLLYDVNSGEGFNLRRDVYIRVSNLVKVLNEKEPWTLVLPPWGNLYHWRSAIDQHKMRWSTFFDIESLRLHVPVIEFEEFLSVIKTNEIDDIYYLQRYEEGWGKGWEEKRDIRPCIDSNRFKKDADGLWHSHFWGYGDDVVGKSFQCLSAQTSAVNMKNYLWNTVKGQSVFLVRAETLIHGSFSEWSKEFWTARRSIVFSKHLRDLGDTFRQKHLDSTDEEDKTVLQVWTKMENAEGTARGGPYIAIHMRRQDYLHAHPKDIPSVSGAAEQTIAEAKELKLKKVFLATDAPQEEVNEFKKLLEKAGLQLFRYKQTADLLQRYGDGGMAIIDQWICAHARHFIGTYHSTFSFRIHEERSILGFSPSSTFNRLCPDKNTSDECEKPTHWPVKFY